MKALRVGLIGCGGIARWGHAPYLKQAPRVDVVAVCDILEERVNAYGETEFPSAARETDYTRLLARADVDAVDICTPNDLHSEIAVAALRAGKHVFCEKPDAVSPDKVLAMKAAAEESGNVLMVMRNNRFSDPSQYAKRFIEAGKMGPIYAGRCGWQRRRGIPGKGGWFTTRARSGGGPLIDLGVHMIDLAIWLMGNPRPVAVTGATYCKFAGGAGPSDSVNAKFGDAQADGVFDVEDLAMGMIRFDTGAVLQIECSWASNIKEEMRFVELRGEKAGMLWRDGQTVEMFTELDGELVEIKPSSKMKDDGHARNLAHFVDVVLDGATPCYEPQQGVDMIRILDAVYASAKTGREVVL